METAAYADPVALGAFFGPRRRSCDTWTARPASLISLIPFGSDAAGVRTRRDPRYPLRG